jgi:hypothetical protein
MSNQKTHWKKLTNPDYLGAYSLMTGETPIDLTVTITGVGRQTVTGADGKKDECTVATIANQKPLILNATNCKTITKIYGTPHIEDWIGKQITLYVAKVKIAGDTVDALRIRPTAPKLPELTPTHERWNGAFTAVQSGTTTVADIRKRFELSAANEALLTAKPTTDATAATDTK